MPKKENRGGARKGAGRPKGQGKFGVPTVPIRVPQDMVMQIMNFVLAKGYELPLFASKISAGFPSPADDYVEGAIDLNRHLIKHPTATFFVRVAGDSMIDAGIHPDDILIVDRSLNVTHGKIVIAAIDNNLTVKRFYNKNGKILLMPENKKYQPIEMKEGSEMVIWGVVTNVIHSV